jgi:hypothetical protein
MNLTDYPTPITDAQWGTRSWFEDEYGARQYGAKFVHEDFARDLERRLAACREALEMIATFTIDDGQCDNGHGPGFVARESLSLTAP